MVRNQEKFEQVMQLRRRGFTLEEIARYCDISKSTASGWLKGMDFSAQVTKQNIKRAGAENAKRLALICKARDRERLARYHEAERSAETEFKHYKNSPLFVAGLMLYKSEGDNKSRSMIRLASIKPDTHRIFIKFAMEYLGVDKAKIHFWILLYPDLDEVQCMKKWHKITGIPYSQFNKNQIVNQKTKRYTLHHGVGNTIICSTVLKYKLAHWIKLMTKTLIK